MDPAEIKSCAADEMSDDGAKVATAEKALFHLLYFGPIQGALKESRLKSRPRRCTKRTVGKPIVVRSVFRYLLILFDRMSAEPPATDGRLKRRHVVTRDREA
jgi:hypothetical protein